MGKSAKWSNSCLRYQQLICSTFLPLPSGHLQAGLLIQSCRFISFRHVSKWSGRNELRLKFPVFKVIMKGPLSSLVWTLLGHGRCSLAVWSVLVNESSPLTSRWSIWAKLRTYNNPPTNGQPMMHEENTPSLSGYSDRYRFACSLKKPSYSQWRRISRFW